MSVVTDLINQISVDLEELKKAYTKFLSDQSKMEPHDLRRAMESRVRQLRGFSNLRTEERFRTQNALSKVTSMTKLWDKQVERKYEGKPRKTFSSTPQADQEQTKDNASSPNESITIGNAAKERDKVVKLYDEYMRLNLLLGSRKMINFGKFQAFIQSQTQKIQKSKQVGQVKYQVAVKDQQVVIKSKSIK